MARNAHERPNVTAARAQSGEERMAGRIKDKGRDLRRLERVAMLLFDGTVIHMPFLGWGPAISNRLWACLGRANELGARQRRGASSEYGDVRRRSFPSTRESNRAFRLGAMIFPAIPSGVVRPVATRCQRAR